MVRARDTGNQFPNAALHLHALAEKPDTTVTVGYEAMFMLTYGGTCTDQSEGLEANGGRGE